MRTLIYDALEKRKNFPDNSMVRLFNGFSEGLPKLVIERFGETVVIADHSGDGIYFEIVDFPKIKSHYEVRFDCYR